MLLEQRWTGLFIRITGEEKAYPTMTHNRSISVLLKKKKKLLRDWHSK